MFFCRALPRAAARCRAVPRGAARCRALAGDADAAVALLQRLEAEAPNLQLAPHVSAQLKELRALRSQ